MSRLDPLPKIMLAPNGARRTKSDHPALPMTHDEILADAISGHAAGAEALHAHVRDDAGGHSLDPGRYRELVDDIARLVPEMPVQITTESAGKFAPQEQMSVVRAVEPEGISMAPREMWSDPELERDISRFYAWCAEADITIQHILFDTADIELLGHLTHREVIPTPKQCIFVLGSYEPPQPGRPEHLAGLLAACETHIAPLDWAVCAFGRHELPCLVEAARLGGALRTGFENNSIAPDGAAFANNAEGVRTLVQATRTLI